MKIKVILCLLLFTLISNSDAKEIKIGLEVYEPYYVYEDGPGILPQLISAVFNHIPEHQPKFVYNLPNKRILVSFQNNLLDAAPNMSKETEFDGCLSDPIFKYQNVAITKRNSNLQLNKISDLTDKSIVTFRGARAVLGEGFNQIVSDDNFIEVKDLDQHVKMLTHGRMQVSILDKIIFMQSVKDLNNDELSIKDFKFHNLFKPHLTHMGFRDKSLCKPFNEALSKVIKSGEYDRIYNSAYEKLESER